MYVGIYMAKRHKSEQHTSYSQGRLFRPVAHQFGVLGSGEKSTVIYCAELYVLYIRQ